MEINEDEAYEKLARPDPKNRQKFLNLVQKARGLDEFAGLLYHDSPGDIDGVWRKFIGDDDINELAEEKQNHWGMNLIHCYVDETKRILTPLMTNKAMLFFGKGHKSVCYIFAKEFETLDYGTFMSLLIDHEYMGHAVPYNQGLWLPGESGGKHIGFQEWIDISGLDVQGAFNLFASFYEVGVYNHQLTKGAFRGEIDPNKKPSLEDSYLREYIKLWCSPQTPFRDSLIEKNFYEPWIGRIAQMTRVDEKPSMLTYINGPLDSYALPDRLAQRLSI